MKILRIKFDGIVIFKNGLDIDFSAQDRVFADSSVYEIKKPIFTQHSIALFGINASGKTTALKLINLAMQIVLNNGSLNSEAFPSILLNESTYYNGVKMEVFFYKDSKIFKLQSHIKLRFDKDARPFFYYEEEFLQSKLLTSVQNKRSIYDFSKNVKYKETRRSQLTGAAFDFLKDDVSIVMRETKSVDTTVDIMLDDILSRSKYINGRIDNNILNVFDENIEKLETEDEKSFTVKFKNCDAPYKSHIFSMEDIISSGTLRGQKIINNAINALKNGGYLIVDELENHLNKELVKMIIQIFNNKNINKKGACLIFTTHYAEILDAFDRMDNIYVLTRDPDNYVVVQNYSQKVDRNEWKKSELLLSNYIKGTAPKAASIFELEEFVCREI